MRNLKWVGAFCMTLAVTRVSDAQVFDQAGIFSQETVDRANNRIDTIHRRTGYDLRIETYAAMPADIRTAWEAAGKNEGVLKKWADARANATDLRGMILLITMDPKHVRGDIGTSGALTLALRDKIVSDVTSELRAKQNDAALGKAVEDFDGAIGAGTPLRGGTSSSGSSGTFSAKPNGGQPTASPQSRSPSSFGLGSLLCVGIAVVLIVLVIRALLGARRNAGWSGGGGSMPGAGGVYPPGGYTQGGYPPQQSSGGGFMSSMLGGLLGGAAGSAAYGYFSRDREGSNYQGQGPSQMSGPAQPDFSSDFRNVDSNASDPGGGGDFGGADSSSSFDSGGGGGFDSGGGSGGDSGGGGDF